MKHEIALLISKQTTFNAKDVELLLTVPPDPKLGDYAFPCFTLGKNPHQEAEKLQQILSQKLPAFIAKIEVVGPYLNFFVKSAGLAEETLQSIHKTKKKYGSGKEKKNVVIEYCGPNTNKPLHLGHLRNIALGNATAKILAFRGNRVHAVNIINDRGIHICQSMLAYQKWGKNKKPDKKGDHFVGDYYVLFAQKADHDPGLQKEAQEMLVQWERGDRTTRALWKKMTTWVLKGFKETYHRLGIQFEKEYFESDYYEKGKELVQEGLKQKVFVKDSSGAVIAPLQKYGVSDKILLRGDETSLYITQDMYLAALRYHDFTFDQMIYVVASEQQLHFQQLFTILKLLRKPYASKMHHLSYGLVHLPSGRMKSREGTVVDADDIMEEVALLARQEVTKRYSALSSAEIKKRAEFISQAALKFFLLRSDTVKDITFNPEESLNFDGETGPYVQYTHARACSILRKAKKSTGKVQFNLLVQPQEHLLVKLLADFPQKVDAAAQHYKPHLLCHYLISLSQGFNDFYHSTPVISDDLELMKARLLLVDCVRQVLDTGLSLLGITAPERM
ncbi:MAG: arginine--tRNA ligase [Nanoarchaeota archaeon]|nr:arginine--tRNA ligase [Nanoarchaeota archaeon]